MPENVWIRKGKLPEQTSENYLGQIKRVSTAAGLKGLQGIESLLFGLPEFLVGRPNIPQEIPGQQPQMKPLQQPSEIIQEKFGLNQEYLQPRNLPESYLQRFAENALPSLLSGGTSALGRTAIGSGVGTLLGAANLPEVVQDIGQLGTEIGLGFKSGRNPTVRAAQKAEDSLMRAAVKPGTKANADKIVSALTNVERELGTEVSEKYGKKIKHVLETVSSNITKNEISPTVAVDLRKKIYNLSKELPANINANYINPITESLNDFFAIYAAENPSFYKHLASRDKLTSFKHMNTVLPKLIDRLNLNKLPGGQIATDIINFVTHSSEKFLRGLLGKNSEARKYYFNIISNAAEDNPLLAIKNAKKLAGYLPEFNQKKMPESKNVWIRKKI